MEKTNFLKEVKKDLTLKLDDIKRKVSGKLDDNLKVLDIRRRTLGSDHDDVAMSLLNLGVAYFEQEMMEEALAR